MVSEGTFWASLGTAKILGNKLKIIKEIQDRKGAYSPAFFANMHSDDYRIIYDTISDNADWEIMLNDESFFQFTFRKGEYSMAFYPRPSVYTTYDDWIAWFLLEELEIKPEDFEKEKEELILESDTKSDYEQFLNEAEALKTIVPVRFDYDVANYMKIYHPLCHFHFGVNNSIRIATDKFMTPLMFFHFVLKNYYPDTFFFKDKAGNRHVSEIITLSKASCNNVPTKLFLNEELLLHFT